MHNFMSVFFQKHYTLPSTSSWNSTTNPYNTNRMWKSMEFASAGTVKVKDKSFTSSIILPYVLMFIMLKAV